VGYDDVLTDALQRAIGQGGSFGWAKVTWTDPASAGT
jgi:hypothetical protein